MKLAGFVPLSLCDYPGRVAAVVFTQGCNFRCPWCHNGHLLPLVSKPSDIVSEAHVLSVLAERCNRLGGVVVSGGEPTLQPALPRFLGCLKALGLDVKLDTNGAHPDVLRQLLDARLLDYVAMDVKAPWDRYAALTGLACCDVAAVQASMALIAASGVPHAFRTTRVDPLLSEQEYGDIRMQIPQGSMHTWQTFRPAYSHDPALRAAEVSAPTVGSRATGGFRMNGGTAHGDVRPPGLVSKAMEGECPHEPPRYVCVGLPAGLSKR